MENMKQLYLMNYYFFFFLHNNAKFLPCRTQFNCAFLKSKIKNNAVKTKEKTIYYTLFKHTCGRPSILVSFCRMMCGCIKVNSFSTHFSSSVRCGLPEPLAPIFFVMRPYCVRRVLNHLVSSVPVKGGSNDLAITSKALFFLSLFL